MAFLRTTVTGSIFLPDGSVMPDGANIIFTLRSWDKDADMNAVALPGPVIATVVDGAISVDLIRTASTDLQTTYDVGYIYRNQWTQLPVPGRLGVIAISGAGPLDIADILALPAPVPNVPDALAQALAAAVDAMDAAASANAAAYMALVGTGTGFDSVQEMLDSTVGYGANSITHNGETVALSVAAGDRWTADGFPYRILPLGTAVGSYTFSTQGGVLLDALPHGGVINLLQVGAPTDGETSAADSFKLAVAASVRHGGCDIIVPAGAYVVDETINIGGAVTGYVYPNIRGAGATEDVVIRSKLTGLAPVFERSGGTGRFSRTGVSNLAIDPYDESYEGQGIAVQQSSLSFGLFSNLRAEKMAEGVRFQNTLSNSWSEYNTIRHSHFKRCGKGVSLVVNGGNNSFRALMLDDVLFNVPENGVAFHTSGATGQVNLYEAYFDISIHANIEEDDAPTSPHYAFDLTNTNTRNIWGNIGAENDLVLKAAADAEFHMHGRFQSNNGITFDVASNRAFQFSNLRAASAFTDSNLSSWTPSPLELSYADRTDNGEQYGIFRMVGSGYSGLAYSCFAGGGDHWFGQIGFNGLLEAFDPGLRIRADGDEIQTYADELKLLDKNGDEYGHLASGRYMGVKVAVPATATQTGKPGWWAADNSFLYTYTGDGTTHSWVRVAHATW